MYFLYDKPNDFSLHGAQHTFLGMEYLVEI
uniref:Uncharacterized protein n=1 Tax=Setaria italica TaxID=4555 RepID=K4APD3_SETIT